MGSGEYTAYCSFTKAIEHLGDRWSLLIVRQLGTVGPQGFTDLATALPGRISRSMLASRLRRLQTLGLVARPDPSEPHPTYRLTEVGAGLMPMLAALRVWAETWLPDDPAMLEQDPDVVVGWLARRAEPHRVPGRPVVVEIRLHHRHDRRYWIVLQRDVEPYGCLTDPLLDTARYVYVDVSLPALLALARGRCDWADRLADGSVTAAGDPDLITGLPTWFRSGGTRADYSRADG